MKHKIRNFLKRHEFCAGFKNRRVSNFLTVFYFELLKIFCDCKECWDGYFFPYDGLAPHRHDLPNGKFSTTIEPKIEWPDNFKEEERGYGVYYCTNKDCENHIDNYI
ncbi:MAG: hypothetical protein GY757_35235 [bacterium]|nr:hypothetical protein [bacterium]